MVCRMILIQTCMNLDSILHYLDWADSILPSECVDLHWKVLSKYIKATRNFFHYYKKKYQKLRNLKPSFQITRYLLFAFNNSWWHQDPAAQRVMLNLTGKLQSPQCEFEDPGFLFHEWLFTMWQKLCFGIVKLEQPNSLHYLLFLCNSILMFRNSEKSFKINLWVTASLTQASCMKGQTHDRATLCVAGLKCTNSNISESSSSRWKEKTLVKEAISHQYSTQHGHTVGGKSGEDGEGGGLYWPHCLDMLPLTFTFFTSNFCLKAPLEWKYIVWINVNERVVTNCQ